MFKNGQYKVQATENAYIILCTKGSLLPNSISVSLPSCTAMHRKDRKQRQDIKIVKNTIA